MPNRFVLLRTCMRLCGFLLVLALPAMACSFSGPATAPPQPTSAVPPPASQPANPAPATVAPPANPAPGPSISLWENNFSDANGWNKSPYWDTIQFPDVNGDGSADTCGRGIDGVYCGLSNGSGFSAVTLWESNFSDANGWNKSPYWNTIQFPDVNHDGRADVCGRGIDGVYCGISNGSSFSAVTLWQNNFSDANGWNNSPYWNTIQYPDVNGDGSADTCGRGIAGVYCASSNGTTFSAVTLWESNFSDANGWNNSPYWNTIAYPDVNHDGRADVCGRGILGVYCGISNGSSFSAVTLWQNNFSDANGWNNSPYWNTIAYPDVNGDGSADTCGRGIEGVYCATSNGTTFSAVTLWENNFSDANGWNKSPYWDTIQFPDVNQDGRADVCGRGILGVYCGLSNGSSFSAVTLWENNFSDANGWNKSPYWNTIQFPDVNHDGHADVCGRGIEGVYCGLSNGTAFEAAH